MRYSNNTLLTMTKAELIEYLRIVEHNLCTAEQQLQQQIENVRDWRPVVFCKDCKHGVVVADYDKRCLCCSIWGRSWQRVEPNDFCSYGAKRLTEAKDEGPF